MGIVIQLIFRTGFLVRKYKMLRSKKKNMCTIAALGAEKKEVEVGVGFGQPLVFLLNQDSIFDITHNKCSDDD